MKRFETRLLVLLSCFFGLSACFTEVSISQQITSLNVDCKTDEIQISDESFELSGEESWTAKCKGKTYACSYLAESDSGCYPLDE
jgi:hypothetical protein